MNIDKNGILPEIDALDLHMIKVKLMDAEEGIGWDEATCEVAEFQYKRFLTLNKLYPNTPIVPDKVMDTVWHYHILDTRKYHNDSDKIFGFYFHHFPYFGMRGEDDKNQLNTAFENTKSLFLKHFGFDLIAESSKCGGESCRNCVSSCKGQFN
jgi:hypothetical protein